MIHVKENNIVLRPHTFQREDTNDAGLTQTAIFFIFFC